MSEVMLHLSSGQGPEECEWVVSQLVRLWAAEARAVGLICEPVEPISGPNASVLLRVSGLDADAFAAERVGTIRWTGTSPFRPLHKRRNWYVGATRTTTAEVASDLRDADIRYQTLRASGPGGQHVNRTESAVRATHVPTGLTTFSQDQRSQLANRKIARIKLALMLDSRRHEDAALGTREQWKRNRGLERGNEVRAYRGEKFKLE